MRWRGAFASLRDGGVVLYVSPMIFLRCDEYCTGLNNCRPEFYWRYPREAVSLVLFVLPATTAQTRRIFDFMMSRASVSAFSKYIGVFRRQKRVCRQIYFLPSLFKVDSILVV